MILPPGLTLHRDLDAQHPNRIPEAKCLKTLCDILNEYCATYQLKYWIDWGTLLGSYREQKIIDWDNDIDLGLLVDDRDSLWHLKQAHLLRLLQKSFFIQYFVHGICVSLLPHDFESFHLNQIDISFFKLTGNKCIDGCQNKVFRSFFIDEMETGRLYDLEFPRPRHIEDFLTLRYGSEWGIPKKDVSPPGNMGALKDTYTAYTAIVGDMFHVGHLNLLKHAKQHFDKLIVGVHNDQDVMTYKPRPIIPYEQRLEIIRSCKYVDGILENAPPITTDDVLDSVSADYVIAGREDVDKIQKMYPVNPKRLHLIRRTENISSSEIKESVKSV